MPREIIWSDSKRAKCITDTGAAPAIQKPIENTLSLGFLKSQLPAMEEDRKRNGLRVEFFEDPAHKSFMGVRANTPEEMQRYIEHRGFYDKNSRNGSSAMVTEESIEQARQAVIERYGRG